VQLAFVEQSCQHLLVEREAHFPGFDFVEAPPAKTFLALAKLDEIAGFPAAAEAAASV